jgi:carboxymethylenebutenolidase
MPDVEFQSNGSSAPGYLATPASGRGIPVIVLQEWWGVEDSIRRICDAFAAEGFVALAPDLFRGETTTEPDEGEKLMMAMSMDQAERDMRGAVDYLAQHEASEGRGVGSVGFCMGGGLSVWAASANPRVAAAVTYYYVMPHGKPDFSKIEAPVLGHFGTADDFISVEDAKALEQEMRDAGVDVRFEFYEGQGHAFFNDHNRFSTYDPDAASESWVKTLDFLRSNLA